MGTRLHDPNEYASNRIQIVDGVMRQCEKQVVYIIRKKKINRLGTYVATYVVASKKNEI